MDISHSDRAMAFKLQESNTGQTDQRLAAETIRHIESNAGPLPGSDRINQSIAQSQSGVEGRILERATSLGGDTDIPGAVRRARLIARRISVAGLIVAAALGGLAAGQAVAAEQQSINFYWLLLVLLGVNFATLFLWFGMMLLGPKKYRPRAIGAMYFTVLKGFTRRQSGSGQHDYPAALALVGRNFGGPAGRWMMGGFSHGFWSAYLLGGIVLVVLQFSTRQYDFVWETTLLPDSVFIQLTAWLSLLPQAIGLDVPTADQVLQSRAGADPAALAGARRAWATLLMASLLLYGLLPRLLLLILCRNIGRYRIAGTPLDLGHPYYVGLRQRLMPVSESLGVVDPGDEEDQRADAKALPTGQRLPPQDASWVGVEVDPENPWPPADVSEARDLGMAGDREGQYRVLELIKNNHGSLVIAVPLARAADRGLSRLVRQMAEFQPASTWLALLENRYSSSLNSRERTARTTDWYGIATRHGIPADQIFHYQIG